jgi:CTP synthase (UTP-ammonia lyase)
MPAMSTATIALVGDRSQSVRAHTRVPAIVEALRRRDGLVVDPYWIPSEDAEDPTVLDRFDGIWLVPGSPYRSAEGAIAAARFARERGVPFLGTCGGFQHAVLMLARDLCGIADAAHEEYGPQGELVVVALECSLAGHEGRIRYEPGSLMQEIMGAERSVERYHCAYGLDRAYADRLAAAGVRFAARDDSGDVRVLELPDHPFFLGTLFQPELAGDGTRAHPVIRAFATACAARAVLAEAA